MAPSSMIFAIIPKVRCDVMVYYHRHGSRGSRCRQPAILPRTGYVLQRPPLTDWHCFYPFPFEYFSVPLSMNRKARSKRLHGTLIRY